MTRIQYQKGDIFDSKAHVIVNTVNCKGIMGKGLALAFKQRYPAMFKVYQQECKSENLRIGRPSLYKQSTPWILNFPTKNDWRLPSKPEYLEKGLEYFLAVYKTEGIKSIAFPKLGAQNGKLSWDDVGPLMAKYLSQLDIDVYIYIADGDGEYQDTSHDDITIADADDNSDENIIADADREYQHHSHDENVKKSVWIQFSELALSWERLHEEVYLNKKDAKKVANARKSREFTSLADIDSLRLDKVSLKRIKEYIDSPQFPHWR